ncbi:hypothetical protein SAMN05444671_2679 [Flavobacterium sp. CF108]|uniref:hypothetical protein n=1 Tax=unclassified Flavobacterium TaxID=196869 RepID=UPI0008AD0345|nr:MULTISPECIES: hypothetical protein [unclassified Flavobacterium]SEN98863.1 hypothetical protein SAMN04487978_1994 [Flavobacterium sp. fv08]SHH33749.1 hypothetical protein SAMN05444671_2679 [Flavobacterium sp. CF108]
MMNAAVCTIFEGHYHFGVAALSNSLYQNGFRGDIYVGYRGRLPKWVLRGEKETIGKWKEAIVLTPVQDIKLIFLPIVTNYNMANYKPDFMLELWEGPAKEADAMFYFDPDIVINDSWACYEQWINCGVALCEDVNSPLQEFHPRRQGWKNYYKHYHIDLHFKNAIYVNAGFVGLLKKNSSFLNLWVQMQELMGPAIGGLENSIFLNQSYNSTVLKREGFQIFDKPDQDALNVAIEVYNDPVSYMGKEGMGFSEGDSTMSHGMGSPKPWKAHHLLRAAQGKIPRNLDVIYWKYCSEPILAHSKWEITRKLIGIKVAKVIGRFYKV